MCICNSLMCGMEVTRSDTFAKSNPLSSAVRNASCSRGWLRLLVQSIFAAVTVASFILIVLMATPMWPPMKPIHQGSRCGVNTCRIVCRDAPLFGRFEEDIIDAVSDADENCKSIVLSLYNPMFDNYTMPTQWLSRLRRNIHELNMISGNLRHIPADAFMSQYAVSIRILEFHNIVFRSWTADSLVGLSSLQHLYVKDSLIVNPSRGILKAVHDTLQTLTIIRGQFWDPTNVTGLTTFMKLTSVDFSSNYFNDVLGANSFTGLAKCKVLYLNSCKISAIGMGAFDHLHSLEMLFLHNNHLVSIPDGLFSNIMEITRPKPRINLQDNLWHCDCSQKEMLKLVTKDILLIDPTCDSPAYFNSKTFSDLETYCSKEDNNDVDRHIGLNSTDRSEQDLAKLEDIYGFFYVSDECYNGNDTTISSLKIYSPVFGHGCHKKGSYQNGIDSVPQIAIKYENKVLLENNWIKVTYFLKTLRYSMVQVDTFESHDYGLVWYQSTCPNEVYCVNDVPSIMRIYNVDMKANYVFCPILLSTGTVKMENCVFYHLESVNLEDAYNRLQIMLYIATGTVCLIFGAICVYAIIRTHPHLLKGSKRILFVKHKTVDALVLPPKVPLRNKLSKDTTSNTKEKNIFTVQKNYVFPGKFDRNISARSSKSSSPSYISAMIPSEEQLAEWRIRHHFNNYLSIASTRSELPSLSWISSDDALHYSLDVDNDRTYESLK